MKDRKPFELKNTLIIYNIVQVVLSVVLVIEVSAFWPMKRKKTKHSSETTITATATTICVTTESNLNTLN